jgi:hypothetical protein
MMRSTLKKILGLIALVVMFSACSKDSEMFTPSNDSGFIEKRASDDGEVNGGIPGKPGNGSDSGETLPPDDSNVTDGDNGTVDGGNISDDDDDESDDDKSTRTTASN